MRPIVALSLGLASSLGASLALPACGSNNSSNGFMVLDSGGGSSSGGSSGGGSGSSSGGLVGDGSLLGDGASGSSSGGGDGGVMIKTTVYANTDDTLYSVDPMSQAVTMIGKFAGTSDSSTDGAVTDLAVNASGDVYVNTESVVYKAALPSGGTGAVNLTKIATIQGGTRFYALGFAPVGALDSVSEILVGGDSTGALWSIDTTSGATLQLGSFGKDPTTSGNTFELSGDIVFYLDGSMNPTGLATIRSCKSGACGNDFLAGVDMTALKTAYTSKTPAATLLGGIYGGSAPDAGKVSLGPGTGFHDVFGLGAWSSSVFGFTRNYNSTKPTLISIDTATGVGSPIGSPFSFSNGWSGAGVTTKVTISVPPPPPPPAQ